LGVNLFTFLLTCLFSFGDTVDASMLMGARKELRPPAGWVLFSKVE
jgi:hypothetical protein